MGDVTDKAKPKTKSAQGADPARETMQSLIDKGVEYCMPC
jgi:hypothetical protein